MASCSVLRLSERIHIFLLEGCPLSNNTLNKRLRLLGIDTKMDHCAHGFRTTFSTLSHHEEIKDAKAWDGDVVPASGSSRFADNYSVFTLRSSITLRQEGISAVMMADSSAGVLATASTP